MAEDQYLFDVAQHLFLITWTENLLKLVVLLLELIQRHPDVLQLLGESCTKRYVAFELIQNLNELVDDLLQSLANVFLALGLNPGEHSSDAEQAHIHSFGHPPLLYL